MRLRKRGDRVVLFRVTEHEHQALRETCAARGESSLAEFVRVEVLNPARCENVESRWKLIGSMERQLISLKGIRVGLPNRIESLSGTRTVLGSGVTEVHPT